MYFGPGGRTVALGIVTVREKVSWELWYSVERSYEKFLLTHDESEKQAVFTAQHISEGVSLYLDWCWQAFKAGSSRSPSSGRTDNGAWTHCTCKSDDLQLLVVFVNIGCSKSACLHLYVDCGWGGGWLKELTGYSKINLLEQSSPRILFSRAGNS